MVVASFWRGWVSLVRPAARKARASRIWRTLDLAERRRGHGRPLGGVLLYLEETCRLQVSDRGLNDAMGMRFPRTPAWSGRGRLFDLGGQLISRAQQSGQLRADFTREDLALVAWANSGHHRPPVAASPPSPSQTCRKALPHLAGIPFSAYP
jgi:transcriptional regulator SbtR-like protein